MVQLTGIILVLIQYELTYLTSPGWILGFLHFPNTYSPFQNTVRSICVHLGHKMILVAIVKR